MALFRSAWRAEGMAGVLVVLSLVLLALPEARQDSFARAANHVVLLPLAGARNVMGGYLGLREENGRLRAELQAARLELGATEGLRIQNRDLSRMLEFREDQPVDLVPTRVIDRDFATLPTTLVIDAGWEDGVRIDQPVVTLEGLIGKTVDVGRSASEVMLYSHPEFSASAMLVGGDHLEYGVVRAAPNGDVELYLPLRSRSEPGDRIVSSGYGGTFPRGIPIGTVERGREDQRLGLQKIDLVRPVVDLGSVGAAFVLRRVVDPGESVGDVPRLFWPGYAYPPMAGEAFGIAAPDSVPVDSTAADTAPATPR
ncbi:MAG TPA: rod shape-determining protein MreC [Gemmatimonadota bacterium]|nr:rod shape-determining protein MreC [Gemmatimonadota bacterium]